jgi:hypothetical protein
MALPGDIVLNVPYYSQRISHSGEALRMCFSASMAMCIEFLKPGSIKGKELLEEDDYLDRLNSYGDTTDPQAHIKAAKTYGVTAKYHQDGNWDKVHALLKAGKPVPLAILHHGPLGGTLYGGHWIVALGVEKLSGNFIFNDPYGHLLVDIGEYESVSGEHVRYDKSKLTQRWQVEGPSTGWYMELT